MDKKIWQCLSCGKGFKILFHELVTSKYMGPRFADSETGRAVSELTGCLNWYHGADWADWAKQSIHNLNGHGDINFLDLKQCYLSSLKQGFAYACVCICIEIKHEGDACWLSLYGF